MSFNTYFHLKAFEILLKVIIISPVYSEFKQHFCFLAVHHDGRPNVGQHHLPLVGQFTVLPGGGRLQSCGLRPVLEQLCPRLRTC